MGKWFRDKHGKLKAEYSENVWINGPTGRGVFILPSCLSEEGNERKEGSGGKGGNWKKKRENVGPKGLERGKLTDLPFCNSKAEKECRFRRQKEGE